MTNEKIVKAIVTPRHGTALDWSKALNFIPKNAEIIIYDIDNEEDVNRGYYIDSKTSEIIYNVKINNIEYEIRPSNRIRIKFGNGIDNVNVLPFMSEDSIKEYSAPLNPINWIYTINNSGIFTGSIQISYDKNIVNPEDRTINLNISWPKALSFAPIVSVGLSNTSGTEHWIESYSVNKDKLESVTFATLGLSEINISGNINIMVQGCIEQA